MKNRSVLFTHKKHLTICLVLLLITLLQSSLVQAEMYRGGAPQTPSGIHCGGYYELCMDSAQPHIDSCTDHLQYWFERDPYPYKPGVTAVNLIVRCFTCYKGGEPVKTGGWWAAGTQYPTYTCNTTTKKNLGNNGCNGSPNTLEGNPCDAATGNKFQTEVDFQSNTLNFVRYYNSLYESQSVFGLQWTHSFLASLTIEPMLIKVNRPDGKVLEFVNQSGVWTSDADITDTLTPSGLHWEYKTSSDNLETYDENGRLLSIITRNGKTTLCSYNTNNLLQQVTDPYGRSLNLSYDASGRLVTLTTPDNTQIHYSYDTGSNLLTSVSYPDNTPNNLSDNPGKTYHYEDPNYPHHLTGITDENQVRYATWAYDKYGRAILSEHANGAEKVDLQYRDNINNTVVTDALGQIKTYTFETHFNVIKPKTIQYQYHDGTQQLTKTKSYTYYPANGQIKEIIDYKGKTRYFEYNNRGLITLEVQAKGTPEEYAVSTTWHPDYRLPLTRTYPDKTVSYNYDTKGQLIATQTTGNP